MAHYDVPVVPGPPAQQPVLVAQHPDLSNPTHVSHLPAPARTTAGPVLVGEAVDLAHELNQLRKLATTNAMLTGVTLVLALFAVIFAGFVAYELWRFLAALEKAFG